MSKIVPLFGDPAKGISCRLLAEPGITNMSVKQTTKNTYIMKHLNFLSKSSSQSCGHSSVTLALTVGSPSAHRRGAMLRLLSVLVLILTFGVGQMWGADTQQTYTLSTAHNNSSQTTGAVTWQIGANAIGAGNGSNPLQKLQGTITVVLPANAQLNSVTINKGSGWGSNARVQFKVGNTVLNTFSTNGTYTLKSTDNKTNLTYSFQYSGSSGNAWVSSIAVSYEIVAATPATVILHDADGSTNVANKKVGDSYTLPNTAATCTGKVFLGWSTSEIATTNTKPTYYKKAESVTLVATNNFYAVYASENGSTIDEVDYTYTFSDVATAITATDASTFSLSWTKGNSNTVYNGGVRLYGGGKLKISSSKTIKAIEFTKGTSSWDNTFTANVGSYNDTNKKWEGSATSITFTESGTSGHKNIASIKITYETTVTAYNKYTTSCCSPLGSINGSFFWTTHFCPVWPAKHRS